MKLHDLRPVPGSRKRKKIIGRGEGSGHGGSATRGTKGQGARSGSSIMVGFEGGQMPLIRRIPKRGFNHRRFKTEYQVINVTDLDVLFADQETVSPDVLRQKGIIKTNEPLKILGDGDITKKLTISAHAFSKSAEEKIKKAGGTATRIEQVPVRKTAMSKDHEEKK